MLEWLADHVSSFRINHNAHREFAMTVAAHLRHRERIGDAPELSSASALSCAQAKDELWELETILEDGSRITVAGPDLASCIGHVRRKIATNPAQNRLVA